MPLTGYMDLGYLGIGKQSAFGTSVAPSYFFPFDRMRVMPNQDLVAARHGNVQDVTYHYKRSMNFAGDFRGRVFMIEAGAALAWVMGADSKSGDSDPYTHALTLVNPLPWLSVEQGIFENTVVNRIQDAKIGKYVLEGKAGEDILQTLEIVGGAGASESAATVAFNDDPEDGPAVFGHGAFTITGPTDGATLAGQVAESKFTIDHNLQTVPGPDSLAPIGLMEGPREILWDGVVNWSGDDIWNLTYWGASNGTGDSPVVGTGSGAWVITTQDSPEHSITLTWNQLAFTMAEPNINGSAKLATAKVQVRLTRDGATLPFTATVKNSESSSYI